MTDFNLDKLAQLGFKKININWIGKVRNYYFSILDKQDSENELIISITYAPNENKSKIFEFFDGLQTEKVISDYGMEKDIITVTFVESDNSGIDTFINQLANNFDSIGLTCKCSCCDETDNLHYFTEGYNYRLLCDTCAEKFMADQEKYRLKSNRYFLGFVYSLVGALIGSIVWILIGIAGFVASIAGVAISYCAFKGYEIARAKISRKGIILNVFSIIIAFLIAQYIGLFLELRDEVTFSQFVYITPYLFRDWEFIKACLPNFGLGLLFAFLGCSGTISKQYKAAKYVDEFKIEKIEF